MENHDGLFRGMCNCVPYLAEAMDTLGTTLLLVDIGNSRIKSAVTSKGELTLHTPFPTDVTHLSEILDVHWKSLVPSPQQVYISNVAGKAIAEICSEWIRLHWGIPVHFIVSKNECCGVINGYDRPEQLGVDRWAGLVGLRHHYPLPACLVDCGTALTFDLLDKTGHHLGGGIIPGPELMKKALLCGTRGVATFTDYAVLTEGLGRNTESAVTHGVFTACAAWVEKTVHTYAPHVGGGLTVLVTGGGDLSHYLDISYFFDASIVLKGLFRIAEEIRFS